MSGPGRIEVTLRVGHHHEHVVATDRVRLGRLAVDNDVVLDGESVSGHHAELVFRDGSFLVRDTDSLVGTLLNGRSIVAERVLVHGDTVVIGSFRLSIDLSDPEVLRGHVERDPKLSLQRLVVEFRRTHHGTAAVRAVLFYGGGGTLLAALGLAMVLWQAGWGAFAPGPPLPGHTGADGPQGCGDCHVVGQGPLADNCLACHARGEVRHDRVAEVAVDAMSCAECHVEHGRVEGLWALGVRPDGCARCHEAHPEREAHPVTERTVGTFAPPFSHADHTGIPELPCGECHRLAASPRSPDPGSFEGCLSCHEGWEVDRHTAFAQCGRCHDGGDLAYDEATQGRYVHEVDEACWRCHTPEVLFATGLTIREVPSPEGFEHATPEHGGACAACHPDMERAVRVVDVQTATLDSEACQRCHGAEQPLDGCPDCHRFHDGALPADRGDAATRRTPSGVGSRHQGSAP